MKRTLGLLEQAALLAVMRLGDRAYGVSVRDDIQERLGKAVSFGAVYTTLDRLENKGYVKSRTGDAAPERGGRAKRFFQIQGQGISALEESKKRHDRLWEGATLPI